MRSIVGAMNTKRFVLAFVATFVFVFLFEGLWHGVLMMPLYEATEPVWRPRAESSMAFLTLGQLLYALLFTYIFTRNYEARGIGEGLRFGLLMGLLVGSIQVGTYSYLPIPVSITLLWVLAEVLKGLGAGVILSLTYKENT